MFRVIKYAGVGVIVTLFDYVVYTISVMVVFQGNTDLVSIGSMIAGFLATIFAYFMHSRITWQERNPGKNGVLKFFAWNILMSIILRPIIAEGFSLLTGLYQFAFMVSGFLHLPFSYEFIVSTGVYCLMTAVVMVSNFLVYEKFVFGGSEQDGKQINMKSVGQARKEKDRQSKSKKQAK